MSDLNKHNEDNNLEDRMNRGGDIEKLTRLIGGMTDPFTLCINASWGAGKTTFVKLWKKALEEQGINSIYFSAWEEDFTREPLIALLGEIQGYANEHLDKTIKEEMGEAIKSFTEVGVRLLANVPSTLAKAFMKQKVGIDCDDLIDSLKRQVAESIKKYQEDKQIVEQFKNLLAQVVTGLAGNKPFVIFIDELDRCRPLYAIEFLERVKHLFGVRGLIFVLSTDKEQLGESIRSQYGNIDTERYFRRFFDLTFELRNLDTHRLCEYLYKKAMGEKFGGNFYASFRFLLANTLTNDNPREIEQCFRHLSLVMQMNGDYYKPKGESLYPFGFVLTLVFLKLKYPLLEMSSQERDGWLESMRQNMSKNSKADEFYKLFHGATIGLVYRDRESFLEYVRSNGLKCGYDPEMFFKAFCRAKSDVMFAGEFTGVVRPFLQFGPE